jgi:hypothetical protein
LALGHGEEMAKPASKTPWKARLLVSSRSQVTASLLAWERSARETSTPVTAKPPAARAHLG